MHSASSAIVDPRRLLQILATYRLRWALPAVTIVALAAVYAVVYKPNWKASQALIIRAEAASNQGGLGKFGQPDERKSVQETILEVLKSHGVLGAALAEVGPPADLAKHAAWPTDRDIDGLRKSIKLTPPNGAEFGMTEVFYLEVQDHDRVRAVALTQSICTQLQAHFQQLRDTKAQSVIDELVRSVGIAHADLASSTGRLAAIEKEVGSDLAELRNLHERNGGDSSLQRTATEIENELRQLGANRKTNQELLTQLQAAKGDPRRLVATPNQLLEAQPGLRRLKEGLVDAQIRTAGLTGYMSEDHPLVQVAREAEAGIAGRLHGELTAAIAGLTADLAISGQRLALLENQLANVKHRQGRLAELRTSYSNQLAETANCTAQVERAQQRLAEARALHASAKVASLISPIDAPDAGISPIGPTRAMILLAGIVGGLLFGAGILLVTVQPASPAPAAVTAPAAIETPAAEDAEPAEVHPAFQPRRSLSLKQALYRIAK